jgi:hypothetical protein
VIVRECGVYKTTYAADMAMYPLPSTRWAIGALVVALFLVLPLAVSEYYPAAMASTVYYNRGVLTAAIHVEAIRRALEEKHGGAITGEDVKNGLEHISNFTLGGLVPPLALTPTDHEGGGWVRVWHVKGGKFARETDWYRAYPNVIANQIKTAMAK